MIKIFITYRQSGSMVSLEIHRQNQPVPMETNNTIPQAHESDDSENNSVQEFTICDEKTALINSAIVSFNPFKILHRLGSRRCFSRSLSRPMRM